MIIENITKSSDIFGTTSLSISVYNNDLLLLCYFIVQALGRVEYDLQCTLILTSDYVKGTPTDQ